VDTQVDFSALLAALDPNRPLSTDELDRLYVERQPPVRLRLAQLLQAEYAKVVLWGQSGSGKSTEVVRLDRDLDKTSHSVVVQPGLTFDLSHIGLIELIRLATLVALSHASERGFVPSADLKTRCSTLGIAWTDQRISFAPEIKGGSMGHAIQETAFAIREIEASLGRPVMVLFDGLEKLSTSRARSIFVTNGEALAAWPVRALFVVPPLLVYEPEWDQAERHITDTVFLPALATSGAPEDAAALGFFEALAAKRLEKTGLALSPELLKVAVLNSGGIPRQFVQILRETFIEASLDGLQVPNLEGMNRAIARIRNAFRLKLRPAQTNRIRQLHDERPSSVSREDYDLLAMGCIIQYQAGGKLWHDWNPVLDAA
jgi:GTPase SAR1 family protein